MKAGILAGIAALSGVASTTESQQAQAASETYGMSVGYSDNSLFADDPADAESAAIKIVQMGGNVGRIFYPLNKNTAWENYAQRTCNAFQAASDHGLQLVVAFRGYDEAGSGYVPRTPSEIKQFATTAASIIWTVASKKDGSHPGGCVPGYNNFTFEGINEINNDAPFNRNLGANTPYQAAMIDFRLSRALKKEAAKPEIQANVSFGEALAAGNQDPVSFINDEGQAAKKLGLKIEYDFIDIHPYPKDPTVDPSLTMQNLYKPAKDSISTNFPGADLVWGEVGVNTVNPPASEAAAYNPPVSNNLGVSESTQAKYITNVLKTAASEGSPWVTLFDVKDDGGGSMRSSGEYYVSGGPKSSQPAVRYQIGKYTGR
jgi:hypothetical protein